MPDTQDSAMAYLPDGLHGGNNCPASTSHIANGENTGSSILDAGSTGFPRVVIRCRAESGFV